MKKPFNAIEEELARTVIGSTTVTCSYDHCSDNYFVQLDKIDVWGSNGLNVHEYAEGVFDAVVTTVRVINAVSDNIA